MALGVVAALETANRLSEFKVVGIDGQNEAIQAIKDGKIVVTFTYDNAGKEACETAKLLAGETVEKQWVLPTSTIDARTSTSGSARASRTPAHRAESWIGNAVSSAAFPVPHA